MACCPRFIFFKISSRSLSRISRPLFQHGLVHKFVHVDVKIEKTTKNTTKNKALLSSRKTCKFSKQNLIFAALKSICEHNHAINHHHNQELTTSTHPSEHISGASCGERQNFSRAHQPNTYHTEFSLTVEF